MGRVYSVRTGFNDVAVAEDLIELKAGTTRGFKLLSATVSCETDYDDTSGLEISIKRASGAYSSGDGTDITPVAIVSSGDAAAGLVAVKKNSSTQATGGTIVTLYEEAVAPAAGFQFTPTPEMQPVFAATEAFLLTIAAPIDTVKMSAVVIFEEI